MKVSPVVFLIGCALGVGVGPVSAADVEPDMFNTPEKAAAIIAKHQSDAMPDGYIPTLGFCETDACKSAQAQLLLEFPLAYSGVYQAQRNVAFCLSSGCEGAFVRTPLLGCAWRFVIVASGNVEVDASDVSNMKSDCGPNRLGAVERSVARAQAETLFRLVYKRPFPSGL